MTTEIEHEDGSMPLLDHLEELRLRLFHVLGAFLITSVICFTFSSFLVDILLLPAKGYVPNLNFLKPTEAFMVHIKVSLIAGFLIASPYIFYQIWLFVMPGLYPHEKRLIIPLAFISLVFFIGGVCFSYFGVIRFGLRFLMGFATEQLHPMISIDSYITFSTRLFLAFGIIFELPLVLLLLNQIGLVSVDTLKSKRPVAVVGIFVTSALITPPDVITQILLGFPLIFLYELSIWSAVIINKIKGKEKQIPKPEPEEPTIKPPEEPKPKVRTTENPYPEVEDDDEEETETSEDEAEKEPLPPPDTVATNIMNEPQSPKDEEEDKKDDDSDRKTD